MARETATVLGASDDKVAVALLDALRVAADAMDVCDETSVQRAGAVKVAETAVTDAGLLLEAAEDAASKAADIFEVLEVAEHKVNEMLEEK